MSLTDTARHWLWGCALLTAASRSDVNVAMPHLRGKWSPTKAILWTLEVSCMRHSFAQHIRKRELNILYAATEPWPHGRAQKAGDRSGAGQNEPRRWGCTAS